jgi:hypothetical protein
MKHFSVDIFLLSTVLAVHACCTEITLVKQLGSIMSFKKIKLSCYRPEQAVGGTGRLGLQIFMMFSTMKVVGHQPYTPAIFTPRSILVLIFRG